MLQYIGIDLGGTNVRVARVLADGTIVQALKRPSLAKEGTQKVVENIVDMVAQIDDYASCEGIGIGLPGAVDVKRGVITIATNLPGFQNYPLAKVLQEHFQLPTFMNNDANVAGLAEAVLGAGKGHPIVYYLTHSTGIGGALIIDGKIVSGRKGYAGEVANIIVKDTDQRYNYLNPGAVENEASGTALGKKGEVFIAPDINTAQKVFDLCAKGDSIAQKLVDEMAYALARVMQAIAHVVDPDIFILGGGCTNNSACYFESLKKYYVSMVHEQMADVPIVQAEMAEPGVIGAALLAKTCLGQ